MCTLLTVSAEKYTAEVARQMIEDARGNPHGFSLVLVRNNKASTVVRTMDFRVIFETLDNTRWDRFFLHCRFATQGSVQLTNTHGWDYADVFVMHNGVLFGPDADRFSVDSMAIGQWVCDGGIEHALDKLREQPFANVFMIDSTENVYVVHHTSAGSLYTDYEGNYSTHAVGDIKFPTPDQYFDVQYFNDTTKTAAG